MPDHLIEAFHSTPVFAITLKHFASSTISFEHVPFNIEGAAFGGLGEARSDAGIMSLNPADLYYRMQLTQ